VTASSKLHADDTPVPVLAPGNGRTRPGGCGLTFATTVPRVTSVLRRCGLPIRGSQGRTSGTASAQFRGTLQADAYAGFNQLYEGGRIEQAACWAHVRRKFFDLQQAHASPVQASVGANRSSLRIEKEIRGRPAEERRWFATPAPSRVWSLCDSGSKQRC